MKSKKTKNVVIGLRAASSALGVTRYKLKHHMADGMPNVLSNERRTFDLLECRAWIAINEGADDDGPKFAPILHPLDPRWRERTAASKLRRLENLVASGHLLIFEDALRKIDGENAVLVGALCALYSRVSAEVQNARAGEVKDVIAKEVKKIVAECITCDSPEAWPEPRPLAEDEGEELDEGNYALADGDREVLGILPRSDPRHSFAVAGMHARERALQDRQGELIFYDQAIWFCEVSFGMIRKQCASIAAHVAARLDAKGPNDASAIHRAIEAATEQAFAAIRDGCTEIDQAGKAWIASEYSDAPSIASDDGWLEGDAATAAVEYDFG